MTPLEKLNALEAGELDKVLEGTPFYAPEYNSAGRPANDSALAVDGCALFNAAKVEVTKVVLDEVYKAVAWQEAWLVEQADTTQGISRETAAERAREALTLLQQLKESL